MTRAAKLKAEVSGLERTHRGQPYPMELRRRLESEARRLRDEHELTWYQVGERLGVRGETLERWLRVAPPASKMIPVRLVSDDGDDRASSTRAAKPAKRPTELTVVSPSGWRVEGLTLKNAARLLKALA